MLSFRAGKPNRKTPYYLKERYNPQIGVTWYRMGQVLVKKVASMSGSLYGQNKFHRFDTKAEYEARIKELEGQGIQVR